MPQYTRNYIPGGTFFFTVVTHQRRPFMTTIQARNCLHEAFQQIKERFPFTIDALVLLPDHLHAVLTLPPDDWNYSVRWRRVKEMFTRQYLALGGEEGEISQSRQRHHERAIWQRRFWEHTCRDEDDLQRCIDYLHWNPVKHGLVARVRDYAWSSFHRFVKGNIYPINWGEDIPPAIHFDEAEWE